MNLRDKNRNVTIFLILVIIIFTCFFSIKILTNIKRNLEIENILTQNISSTNWPKDVPIIQSKFINITKLSEKSWEISIKEKISYEEFKAYLIELFSEGFEPVLEMGSDNPKRLSSNEPTEDGFVLLWCGKSEEYSIEAYWTNNNHYRSGDEEYIENCVSILLYANSTDDTDLETDFPQNEGVVSGDLSSSDEISGDIMMSSGDVISGDTMMVSGE